MLFLSFDIGLSFRHEICANFYGFASTGAKGLRSNHKILLS